MMAVPPREGRISRLAGERLQRRGRQGAEDGELAQDADLDHGDRRLGVDPDDPFGGHEHDCRDEGREADEGRVGAADTDQQRHEQRAEGETGVTQ